MQVRYIPQGSTKIANKSGSAVAYAYTTKAGRLCAIGYIGKSNKPTMHYGYLTQAQRFASITEFLRGAETDANAKLARKAEKKAMLAKPHTLKVGDVLRSSWGYEQTNIDYYEVTALVGVRMVEIREIGCMREETGFLQGVSAPTKGAYIGEVMRKKVDQWNGVSISSFQHATKIEAKNIGGVEVFDASGWTAYA